MSRTTSWVRSRSRWALAAGLVGTAALALSTTAALGGFTASITNTGDTASTGSLVMQEVVGAGQTTCLSTGTGAVPTASPTPTSGQVNANNANTTCPANKFGSLTNAKPGDSNSTNVVISNIGSITANTLTMTDGACAQSNNTAVTAFNGTDAAFCGKVDVTIEDDTAGTSNALARCVYPAGTGNCPALSNTYNLTTLATAYTTAQSILPTATPVLAGGARTYKVTVGFDAGAGTTNADQGLTATEPITFTFGQ